eukprot:m.413475 g.413475  ORF g.413475 m.413475 type:complete len:117 (+) comp29107_c0_seq1:1291-1641(+)
MSRAISALRGAHLKWMQEATARASPRTIWRPRWGCRTCTASPQPAVPAAASSSRPEVTPVPPAPVVKIPSAPPSGFGLGYFATCCLIVPTFAYIGQQGAIELVFHINDLGLQPTDL